MMLQSSHELSLSLKINDIQPQRRKDRQEKSKCNATSQRKSVGALRAMPGNIFVPIWWRQAA